MAPIEISSVTVSRRHVTAFAGRNPDRTVVWLRGEHDVSTVAALSETMARAIALDDADVVVDLSDVQFMGAASSCAWQTSTVRMKAGDVLRMLTPGGGG